MRMCQCPLLAPHTAQRSINRQAAASAVSETVFVLSWGWEEREGAETHLSEEHGEDGQADPVDDAGKLECIINCGDKTESFV